MSAAVATAGEEGYQHSRETTLRHSIVELSYRSARVGDSTRARELFRSLLKELFADQCPSGDPQTRSLQRAVIALMAHVRDVIDGKGIRSTFYMFVTEWARHTQELRNDGAAPELVASLEQVCRCLVSAVVHAAPKDHPYGSWRDLRYCMETLRQELGLAAAQNTNIWRHMLTLGVRQMERDLTVLRVGGSKDALSLWGRWAPREKSNRFGWLAPHFAGAVSLRGARRKAAMREYRKGLSALNSALRTVQVAQCARDWASIDFENDVTSTTLTRQARAFGYRTETGANAGTDPDRLQCRHNYDSYVKATSSAPSREGSGMPCAGAPEDELVAAVRNSIGKQGKAKDIDAANLLWVSGSGAGTSLENCIAMVDTSGSMECPVPTGTPLDAALGIGLRIAEASSLGRRLLTFGARPQWIDLTGAVRLSDMVSRVLQDESAGAEGNVLAAMEMIAESCRERDLPADSVERLTLVVLSDMAFYSDAAASLHEAVAEVFAEAGRSTTRGEPYPPPRILYWDLGATTSKVPVSANFDAARGVALVSGKNHAILRSMCGGGPGALAREHTPWDALQRQLAGPRYAWVESLLEITHPPTVLANNISGTKPTSWWW